MIVHVHAADFLSSLCKSKRQKIVVFVVKGKLSDSFTNYNYVGNTKVSVSIKKT